MAFALRPLHRFCLVLLILLLVPSIGHSQVMLTGAIEFSTNANGAGSPGYSQIWKTLGGEHYYDLWLSEKPDATSPVNGPSDAQAGINIPLAASNSYKYYTFGAPGLSTPFAALNLFFDGNNSTPGISVYGKTNGTHFRPNGSAYTLTLTGDAYVAGSDRAYYVSNGVVVVLTGYGWYTPTTPPGDVCQPYEFAPGGGVSFHGYITLHVAPAAALTIGPSSSSPAAGIITLRGSGFDPTERVTIYLGGLSFPVLATATTDESGGFAITLAKPHSDDGPKDVYAVGQNSGKLGAASI